MEIKTIKVGTLQTNCHIISDPETKEAVIIDPGDEAGKIIEAAEGLKVKAVVLTHGHYDHVTDAPKVAKKFNAPLLIHKNDEIMMMYSNQTKADKFLKDKDILEFACPSGRPAVAGRRGSWKLEVIGTPGHSPGGICIYNEKEKVLFSGDTLFYHDYGRCDLPGSSEEEMIKSLKKLLALPPETIVYPGHGETTTIGDEKNLIV